MWNTTRGTRILADAEAVVLCNTIGELIDATVAAIYAQMLIGVECEIEMQQSSADSTDTDTIRRQEIVAALRESPEDAVLPDPECVVIGEWELAIEILKGRVLFDEDFRMYDLAIDLPPDKATNLKAIVGIESDYFVDIPPDPESPAGVWADLIELTTGKRPDEAVF